jgi:hypothetical protein
MAPDPQIAIGEAIESVARLRAFLARTKGTRLVRSRPERDLVKATAQTWFTNHKPAVTAVTTALDFSQIDGAFADLLRWAERDTARATYLAALKSMRALLVELQTTVLLRAQSVQVNAKRLEQPPDFAPLIGDPIMQSILSRRWEETQRCIGIGAALAATVMMGGLLEGLLLARVNAMKSKTPLFTAKACPRDAKTKQPLPLKEWTLKDYIDVAHELKWIGKAARDVGVVVRDYRNYIHPEKERSHGISLNTDDAAMFWSIVTALAGAIVESAKKP